MDRLLSRYKHELSTVINMNLPSNLHARLESYGNTKKELVKNACVYILDSENSEVDCILFKDLSDFTMGKCIIALWKEFENESR